MTKQERIEILFNIISDKAGEGELKNKELKKQFDALVLCEDDFKKDLTRHKRKEFNRCSDQANFLHVATQDYTLKFAIEFMLDFFSIQ